MSKQAIRKFVAKWDLPFAILTVVVYTLMIPILIFVFPDVSNLWLSLFVIIGTWTSAVSALATLLKESDPK